MAPLASIPLVSHDRHIAKNAGNADPSHHPDVRLAHCFSSLKRASRTPGSDLLVRYRASAGTPVARSSDPSLAGLMARRCAATWQAGASAKTAAVGNRMSDAIMSSGHACQ
jgi:hypothetical protein